MLLQLYKSFLLTILLIIYIHKSISKTFIFVTSKVTCFSGINCDGSPQNPYDSLAQVLNGIKPASDSFYSIILLGNLSTPHFFMNTEYIYSPSKSLYYDLKNYSYFKNVQNFSLEIKPILCYDPDFSDQPDLLANCLMINHYIILKLKTENLNIFISGILTLQNIIIDGSEDIAKYNSNFSLSSSVSDCIYSRKTCCGEENFKDGVFCAPQNIYLNQNEISLNGLFNLDFEGSSTIPTVFISNVIFQNINFVSSRSLFKIDPLQANLTIENSTITHSYFIYGIISMNSSSNCVFTKAMQPDFPSEQNIEIAIMNTNIDNYNPYNIITNSSFIYQNPGYNEGYFLNLGQPIQGSIRILNTSLANLTGSIKSQCLNISIINQQYQYLFTSSLNLEFPNKIDISKPFINDNIMQSTSTSIFICSLKGNLSLNNSKFSGISGISGSVMSLNHFTRDSNIIINNNKFIDNYAIIGFATLRIYRPNLNISLGFYASIDCKRIKLTNNIFDNNNGCPGSYGNVIIYCDPGFIKGKNLLDTEDIDEIDVDNFIGSLYDYQPHLLVDHNTFSNNTLAFSNSLVIVGFTGIIISNNTFTDNGIMFGNYRTLVNPYGITNHYNSTSFAKESSYWFTQTSALFISVSTNFKIKTNVFINNWAIVCESMLFGSQITLDSIILISDLVSLTSNTFENNTGLPESVFASLNSSEILSFYNAVIQPLVTINYFNIPTSALWVLSNYKLDIDIRITINNVTFVNNTMKMSFQSFQYNLFNSSTLFSDDYANFNGMIRFYSNNERKNTKIDEKFPIVSIDIINGNFTKNSLLSPGCFFSNFWIYNLNFLNSTFSKNFIYTESIDLTNSIIPSYPKTNFHGIFSVYFKNNLPEMNQPQITISNSTFSHNNGTIMTDLIDSSLAGDIQLANTNFTDNICLDGGLIISISQAKTQYTVIYCQFTNNVNIFGIWMLGLLPNYNGKFNRYINNQGVIAGIFFEANLVEDANAEEVNTYFEGNTVNINLYNLSYYQSDKIKPIAGIIYLEVGSYTEINCTHNNSVGYAGIYVSSKSFIYISDNTYINNNQTGSAIIATCLSGTDFYFYQSKVYNNSLKYDTEYQTIQYGMFNIYLSSLSIYGSIIDNNYADNKISLIAGNTATVTINETSITNTEQNYSSSNPYLIVISFSTLIMYQNILNNNFGITSSMQSEILIQESQFNQNQGMVNDKTIFQIIKGTLVVDNSSFIDSTEAQASGNYIYAYSFDLISISNSIFKNHSFSQGAIIQANLGTVNLTNLTFVGNNIDGTGSDISLSEINQFILDGSSFFDQSPFISYIKISNSIGDTIITNSQFVGFSPNTLIYLDQINNLLISNISINGQWSENIKYDISITTSQPGVYISSQGSSIRILDSIFMNIGNSSSALQFQVASDQEISFINNTLSKNVGISGGALIMNFLGNNSFFNIQQSQFSNNFVMKKALGNQPKSGSGGAIYYHCNLHVHCNLKIEKTQFINNTAEIQGGAIYWDYHPPNIDLANVIFSNNSADYGPDLATLPIKFILLSNQTLPNIEVNYDWSKNLKDINGILNYPSQSAISNIVSGKSRNFHIIFSSYDIYGQQVHVDNYSMIDIDFSNGSFSNTTPYIYNQPNIKPNANIMGKIAVNGLINFTDFQINFWPDSNITASFKINNFNRFARRITSKFDSLSSTYLMNLSFRSCIIGEVFQIDGTCKSCNSGLSLLNLYNNSIDECRPCNNNTEYCFGGAIVGPAPGYWRKNATANLILKCTYKDACLGNNGTLKNFSLTGECANGYWGNLCDSCGPNMAKYNNICISCINDIWYYIKFIIFLLIQAGFIIISVSLALKSLGIHKPNELSDGSLEENTIQQSDMIKCLTNYVQMITIIAKFGFRWPQTIIGLFSIGAKISATSDDYFSFDCIFSGSQNYYIDKIYLKYIIIFLYPYLGIAISIIFWVLFGIYKRYKYKKADENDRNQYIFSKREFINSTIATSIIIIFNLQPNLIRYAFNMFQCKNLYRRDVQEYYLNIDYETKCFDSNHIKWSFVLGLLNISLWGIILPIIIFIILYKNKENLNQFDIRYRYSFIYRGYDNRSFYWELVVLIRKFLMISVLVFLDRISIPFQAISLLIIVLISLAIQNSKTPHKYSNINRIEQKSLMCTTAISLMGLCFLTIQNEPVIEYITIVITIIANLYFISFWMINYLTIQYNNNNKIVIIIWKYYQQFIKRFFHKIESGEIGTSADQNERKDEKQPTPLKKNDKERSLNVALERLNQKEITRKDLNLQGKFPFIYLFNKS